MSRLCTLNRNCACSLQNEVDMLVATQQVPAACLGRQQPKTGRLLARAFGNIACRTV